MKRISLQPARPERICWGCTKYCPADDLACGNGTIRTPHPVELFGADWAEWADRAPLPAVAETGRQPRLKGRSFRSRASNETT